jgi:hypothetical protein
MFYLLILKKELKLFEILASHSDFISSDIESITVFMLSTGLVVSQHAVAAFHGQDFVVDTTVVSVLVSKVVQLLSQLSNKLVFLSTANCNSASGIMSLNKVSL